MAHCYDIATITTAKVITEVELHASNGQWLRREPRSRGLTTHLITSLIQSPDVRGFMPTRNYQWYYVTY